MNNEITLIGHVGQAPVSKLFGDTGNKVIKFSIAVKEYSSNTEEGKTMWIDVDAWNGVGETVLATVTRGREIVVKGRLSVSHFSKEINGTAVPMTKPVVKLTGFHLCGRKPVVEMEELANQPAKPRRRAATNA